ncbi:hypothetical protein ACEQUB_p01184 (plasmid) [Ralstonia syzygii]
MQSTRSRVRPSNRRRALHLTMAAALAASLFGGAIGAAHAEASEVRISHGYGILYLPIMVMASEHLLEKQAKAAGLGDVKVSYRVLDGGNVINDAMLSGALDIASLGVARYAEFMQRVGTLKGKPASWKDLFFPTVQNRQGS